MRKTNFLNIYIRFSLRIKDKQQPFLTQCLVRTIEKIWYTIQRNIGLGWTTLGEIWIPCLSHCNCNEHRVGGKRWSYVLWMKWNEFSFSQSRKHSTTHVRSTQNSCRLIFSKRQEHNEQITNNTTEHHTHWRLQQKVCKSQTNTTTGFLSVSVQLYRRTVWSESTLDSSACLVIFKVAVWRRHIHTSLNLKSS